MGKYLIAFVLIMHGLAHVSGPIGFWTSGSQAFADRSWLFSGGISSHSLLGRAFGLLWLVAALGLIGAGLGLLFSRHWWPTLALAGAALSLLAIVPWLRVVPPGAWAGAGLDLVVLVALLLPWGNRIVQTLG